MWWEPFSPSLSKALKQKFLCHLSFQVNFLPFSSLLLFSSLGLLCIPGTCPTRAERNWCWTDFSLQFMTWSCSCRPRKQESLQLSPSLLDEERQETWTTDWSIHPFAAVVLLARKMERLTGISMRSVTFVSPWDEYVSSWCGFQWAAHPAELSNCIFSFRSTLGALTDSYKAQDENCAGYSCILTEACKPLFHWSFLLTSDVSQENYLHYHSLIPHERKTFVSIKYDLVEEILEKAQQWLQSHGNSAPLIPPSVLRSETLTCHGKKCNVWTWRFQRTLWIFVVYAKCLLLVKFLWGLN